MTSQPEIEIEGFGEMVAQLRGFLDDITVAVPDEDMALELADDLAGWRARLAGVAASGNDRIFGRRRDLPGRGQTMVPEFAMQECDENGLRGTVRFGTYFLGWNGAAFGGSIALVFDEVLSRLVYEQGGPRTRTAYLHTDYRSITPVDVDLKVTATIVEHHGRKTVARAEIWHGDTLCAEAEGLFLSLLPGQP